MSDLNRQSLNFKDLKIDEVQRIIIRKNQEIELIYTEFEILKLVANHLGIVFSKEQIFREKIEDNPSKPIYIQMVWGVGYRLNKKLVK